MTKENTGFKEIRNILADAPALVERIPRDFKDFEYSALKPSGVVPGGVYTLNGEKYFLKNLENDDPNYPNQGEKDYVFGLLYQRVLYNRAPYNNLVRGDKAKGTVDMVSSKNLDSLSDEEYSLRKPTIGFAKIIAATAFLGDIDVNRGGFVMQAGTVLGKIDHGGSGHRMKMKAFLAHLTKLIKLGHTVDFIELLETFKQIVQISDDEITNLISARLDVLKSKDPIAIDNIKQNKTTCQEYLDRVEDLQKRLGVDASKLATRLSIAEVASEKAQDLYNLYVKHDTSYKAFIHKLKLNNRYFKTEQEEFEHISERLSSLEKFQNVEIDKLPDSFWSVDNFSLCIDAVNKIVTDHGLSINDLPSQAWDLETIDKVVELCSKLSPEEIKHLHTLRHIMYKVDTEQLVSGIKLALKHNIDSKHLSDELVALDSKIVDRIFSNTKKYNIAYQNIKSSISTLKLSDEEIDVLSKKAEQYNILFQDIIGMIDSEESLKQGIQWFCEEYNAAFFGGEEIFSTSNPKNFPGQLFRVDSDKVITNSKKALLPQVTFPIKDIPVYVFLSYSLYPEKTLEILKSLESSGVRSLSLEIWGNHVPQFKCKQDVNEADDNVPHIGDDATASEYLI